MGASSVNFLINFYMFICITLLIFNLVYILRAKRKDRIRLWAQKRWEKEIREEGERLFQEGEVSASHLRKMEKWLKKTDRMIAYHEAVLSELQQDSDGKIQHYLDACHLTFQALALAYSHYPAMDRAFFAHAMAIYHPDREKGAGQLPAILLTYFEDSTVFCRENILQALYALGQAQMVERAFALMNREGWYHHSRLLSDGLANFAGDQEQLVWLLWERCRFWTESFQVAVVQFATGVSAVFAESFLGALQDTQLFLETRFALLRYFQRYVYMPAQPVLTELLMAEEVSGLSIAAAAVLNRYPGEDTHRFLMRALHSRNWYVRRNAAASLAQMGASMEDVVYLREHGDPYGADMLEYMLLQGSSAPAPIPAEALREAKEDRMMGGVA